MEGNDLMRVKLYYHTLSEQQKKLFVRRKRKDKFSREYLSMTIHTKKPLRIKKEVDTPDDVIDRINKKYCKALRG